jgi:nitrogen fixation/metabolism regulation signal transduction histidine kinase
MITRPGSENVYMKYILVLCIAFGAILLYLLSNASTNSADFSKNYPFLLALNVLLVLALLSLIVYQLWGLRNKFKTRMFGAKLTLRLFMMFALMAVLPGVLVYGVSVQFLTKSIESWFDVRVDNALEGGLDLGQTALDNLLQELDKKGEAMALSLSDQPPSTYLMLVNSLREQVSVEEATLFDGRSNVITFSGDERSGALPHIPDPEVMRDVKQNRTYQQIEFLQERGLYLRVIVPVSPVAVGDEALYLQLLQPVPRDLAQDAQAVQEIYRDYQELSLSRQGLKKLFALALTLTLLLALLSAIALAYVLSERMSSPLSLLARGTQAVAEGDFTQVHPVHSQDELGSLIQSFNSMTKQLAEAQVNAETSRQKLETANAYLESVLAYLSSGVLAFDEQFRLTTANAESSRILSVELSPLLNTALADWPASIPALSALSKTIQEGFAAAATHEWQKQINFEGKSAHQVLLLRGTHLPMGAGHVVVFDDITHILQAQRDAAWAEVARRLAHEIKNPLTPIQLSAERIEHKLVSKLDEESFDILRRATQTIVNQVGALKGMVNAFGEYARPPQLELIQLDLNALVEEVLLMYESTPIRLELTRDLPNIRGDLNLLRQVIHNLLQNAQDALSNAADPQIVVSTGVEENWIKLTVRDNGSGFSETILARAFEPYVTSKPKGTGLGLAIVKKIVEEHHGAVRIENLKPHGASVGVYLPMAKAA